MRVLILILLLLSSCVTVKCHDTDLYQAKIIILDALIALEAEKALLDMGDEEREDLDRDNDIIGKIRRVK